MFRRRLLRRLKLFLAYLESGGGFSGDSVALELGWDRYCQARERVAAEFPELPPLKAV